jgi:hypothetical protein
MVLLGIVDIPIPGGKATDRLVISGFWLNEKGNGNFCEERWI